VLLVSLCNIVLLGDLAFHEVKRAFMLEDGTGSDSFVVILSSTTSINKAI